ncbi:hypothetical protein [Confluentibacter citreus]|uniref:hypothetical protein n=1 Tax=Confluentibacter citreus TaxID=2007307 RepID=UPI000C28CAA5|nr:hypothetical protein [Confluentibacter citreus]
MTNFKILDRKSGLELNNKKSLNKQNGKIFYSAVATYKNTTHDWLNHDFLCAEIIQKRVLKPISNSISNIDRLYNEMETILRIWIDFTQFSIDELSYFVNENFDIIGDIWSPRNPEETVLSYNNMATVDLVVTDFFDEWNFTKFNIVAYETINLELLPEHILNTIKKDQNLIYEYVIKNHKNEFIVDNNGNYIFRFNMISFENDFKDFLITGKKVLEFNYRPKTKQFKISYTNTENDTSKLRQIEKNFTEKLSHLPSLKKFYETEYETEEVIYIKYLPFSVMYHDFFPQLNLLHSDKYNYDRDNHITTNGIFLCKPKHLKGFEHSQNATICLVFNKLGIVNRLIGNYDSIIENKLEIAREFRYFNDTNTTDSSSKFDINKDKIKWMFFNPNSIANNGMDEPLEYTEYEGEFHEYAIKLTSRITYYDQGLKRFQKKLVFENLIFDLYET